MRRPRVLIMVLLLSFVAAGCRKKEPPSPPQAEVEQRVTRPGATLGIFVSHYLSRGIAPGTFGALAGLDAQARLLAEFDPLGSESTFALLQEFGNVLQADVPDLLNRSADRSATLSAYTDALSNITERSKQMRDELNARINTLRTEERAARGVSSQLQRTINEAYRKQDYATAGSLQEDLSAAQLDVTRINAEAREVRELQGTYAKLIGIAEKRLQAINENREVLIAGLTVIQVPGIENLGILEKTRPGARIRGTNSTVPIVGGLKETNVLR